MLPYFLFATAGITTEDVNKCFGGMVGLHFLIIGGSLQIKDCKRSGSGNKGKCLAMDLVQKETRLFLWTHNQDKEAISPSSTNFHLRMELHGCYIPQPIDLVE